MKKPFYVLPALAMLWACSGTKPTAGKASGLKPDSLAASVSNPPVLAPEEQMLFSEVAEFVKLGQESIQDSLWFQAGQEFDSALVRLSALESTDSLSPTVQSHIQGYRDSVQKLLIFTVAMTSQMSEPVPWTAQFNEEMEEVPDSSVKAIDSITHQIDPRDYELPLTNPLDQRILQAMAVFAGPGRGYFTKWLTRKSRYEELVHKKLEERGMPKDLLYLAMVESGFNPKAWSKASASGMWQFISGTGRRYGLQDDWWYDPRRDPMLATDAALEYLNDLHDEFQDWHMAMAAYNCGEGKIRRFLNQDSTRGYWQMPLPRETRFYVPKILAAMIIGHNPERYGFKIEQPEAPISFDTATVGHCLTIAAIAKSAGVSEDTILSLNPSLRRWCTPPNRTAHTLYLPTGTREAFWRNYERLDKTTLVNWRHHIVAKGENISGIASKYRVSVAAIKATNKIKGNRLHKGQSLLIPLAPEDAGKYLEQDVAEAPARQSKFKGGTYRVRSGDNLFDIARRFGTTVSALLAANNMSRGSVLKAGQRLKLTGRSPAGSDEPEIHREPPVASSAIMPREKAPRAAGRTEAARAAGKFGVHTVGAGETLFSITRSLGVSEDDLRRWNNLRGNRIQAGQKLKYQAPRDGEAGRTASRDEDAPDAADEPEYKSPAAAARELKAAGIAPVAAAGFLGAPAQRSREDRQYYVVKDGDSLWDISVKYRSTVQRLKDLNGKLPPVLRPGTRIRVK
ncbi:MAG TPA: LysM peptidoglycan-binding domain-containing protein [Fibrobacteria bacterium]|nr:LysM peptidoglycan-binding domain-containing protein [Fibrobacteria bacterium]